jgi:hypothetical protein
MITRIRTWTATVGKNFELIALLKEVTATAARVTGRPPGTVVVTVGGNLDEVSLIIQADSLDQSDENMTKIMAHPDFAPLLDKFAPLIESGGFEQIYRHV